MSDVLEVLGLVALTVAGFLVAPALGCAVLGASLLFLGYTLDGVKLPRLPWRRSR